MKEKKILRIRKQVIGENTLYFLIWVLVLLAPFMNSGMMSEEIIDARSSLLSWLKVLPFYTLFLANNLLLYRTLWSKRRYILYLSVSALLIVG